MDTVTQEQIDRLRNGEAPDTVLLPLVHLYTARQAQVYLGVSDATFDLWVAKGAVPVTRFSGQRFLTSDQLRIAGRHARASYERRGKPFEPGEAGEPARFEVD